MNLESMPCRMAQVDMSERSAMQPMTMRHLAKTQLALRELKHVQLLCDSYSKAQHSVFAAGDPADMPPVSTLQILALLHQQNMSLYCMINLSPLCYNGN